MIVFAGGAVGASEATAQTPPGVVSPPMVSGRSIDDSEGVTSGDVLARLILLRDNLDLIRIYMGLAPAPKPLIRAQNVSLGEVYFGGLSVGVRVDQLAFEQLRSEKPWGRPPLPERRVVPLDVFRFIDRALVKVMRVKAALGIKEAPRERMQPDSTTPTELFNVLLEAAGEVNGLLEEKMQASNAYLIATVLVYQAMQIHLAKTKRMMPAEPDLEPNKTPADAFAETMSCFALITKIAERVQLPVLTLERVVEVDRKASLNDLSDLGILMVAEQDRLIRHMGMTREPPAALAPTKKFPSHVLRRTRLLKLILTDIAARVKGRAAK